MEKNKKKRLFITNLFLIAGLFVLISFNKDYIRPAVIEIPILNFLTGIFPNFIAAFLISLAFVNAVITKELKRPRLWVYPSAIFIFLILAFEELVPLWGASEVGDLYDIIASFVGAITTIIIFEIIKNRIKKSNINEIKNN